MDWSTAETAIRSFIETNWALGSFASLPIIWENEDANTSDVPESFVMINIEGTFSDKGIYGSVGKRSGVEGGIIFYHVFVPIGSGKKVAADPVVAMADILQLTTISGVIDCEGANPPSPVYSSRNELDREIVNQNQPSGNYYRCTGSVPFIIRSGL